jgi:hypothetical protein
MRLRHPFRTSWAILLAAAALGPAGVLRADLAPTSPFLPPNSTAAGAQAGPSGPVELRGIMSTSGGVAYCIYDTAKKSSAWVGLNEGGYDFVVKSAEAASDTVTVDFQGRSLKLVLRTAKVTSAAPVGGPGGTLGIPGATPAVAMAPSPADEQKRLDAVAQEVRRRRMERERAVQAVPDGSPAPGGGPVPGPNR